MKTGIILGALGLLGWYAYQHAQASAPAIAPAGPSSSAPGYSPAQGTPVNYGNGSGGDRSVDADGHQKMEIL